MLIPQMLRQIALHRKTLLTNVTPMTARRSRMLVGHMPSQRLLVQIRHATGRTHKVFGPIKSMFTQIVFVSGGFQLESQITARTREVPLVRVLQHDVRFECTAFFEIPPARFAHVTGVGAPVLATVNREGAAILERLPAILARVTLVS